MSEQTEVDVQLFQKGVNLATIGEYQKALDIFESILQTHPNLAGAWYNKGLALAKLSRLQEAQNAMDYFIEIAPPELNNRILRAKEEIKQIQSKPNRQKIAYGLIALGIFGCIGSMFFSVQAPTDPATGEVALDTIGSIIVIVGGCLAPIGALWGGFILFQMRLQNKQQQASQGMWIQLSQGSMTQGIPQEGLKSLSGSPSNARTNLYSQETINSQPLYSGNSGGINGKAVGIFIVAFIVVLIAIVAFTGDVTIGQLLIAGVIASGVTEVARRQDY